MQYPVIIRSHDPLVFLETGTGGPPQAVRLSQVDDSVLDWLIELGADVATAERERRDLNPRANPYHDPASGKFTTGGGGGGHAKPAGAGGGSHKLTDEEFVARQKLVESTLSKNKHLATDNTHRTPDGGWKPERDALHREIADKLYSRARDVPAEGKAVVAGGLGGAGKSTVLRDHAKISKNDYLTINPDDIKEELASRGLVPEVPGVKLSPLERAPLVHEESSRIAKLVADKAYRDRRNVIWDITMSSKSSVESRVDAMRRNGYKEIRGVFVDIPVETSVDRALSRYRRGVEAYNAGAGLGGRYVPPSIIRAQRTSSGSTVNREVFESKTGAFDQWSVYDNSGVSPKLISSSGGG